MKTNLDDSLDVLQLMGRRLDVSKYFNHLNLKNLKLINTNLQPF